MLENQAIGYAKCESNSYNTIAKDEIEELIAVTKNHIYLKGTDENGLRKFLKSDFTTAKTKEELKPLTAKEALKNITLDKNMVSCDDLRKAGIKIDCNRKPNNCNMTWCNHMAQAIDKLA